MTIKRNTLKSERLKKLESELQDLEKWLGLGLVPKKEKIKHEEEIKSLRSKVKEETRRLQFLKESGDLEEYAAPKRPPGKSYEVSGDLDIGNDNFTEEESKSDDDDSDDSDDDTEEEEEEEVEDDPFSDKNRWKRGISDPDADDNW